MTYEQIRKDPKWQKKRLEVLDYANFRCQLCGAKDRTLHVHHSYYLRGKKPWQYPTGSLISLCEDCHSWWHKKDAKPDPIAPMESAQKDKKDDYASPEEIHNFLADLRKKMMEERNS